MRTGITLATIASFAAGVGAATLWVSLKSADLSTEWIELSKPRGERGVTYTTEVAFKSDIALPEFNQFGGRIKFIPTPGEPTGAPLIGYSITVSVPSLELAKVPDKYRKEKPVEFDGIKTTRMPIDQVTYEVVFHIALIDEDGFILKELDSEPQTIQSGKTNEIQKTIALQVPRDVASRTRAATVVVNLMKCLTCQGE